MTDLRQAAQQALEALENAVRYHGIMLMSDPPQDAWKYHRVEDNAKQAITALREALEQPEQEPTCPECKKAGVLYECVACSSNNYPPKPEQEPCVGKDPRCPCQDGDACHYKDCGDTKALPVPVAQPEQEPSQWRDMVVVSLVREGVNKHKARELADHFAAERPWQGMTEKDWEYVKDSKGTSLDTFDQGAAWAANQLRRRNT